MTYTLILECTEITHIWESATTYDIKKKRKNPKPALILLSMLVEMCNMNFLNTFPRSVLSALKHHIWHHDNLTPLASLNMLLRSHSLNLIIQILMGNQGRKVEYCCQWTARFMRCCIPCSRIQRRVGWHLMTGKHLTKKEWGWIKLCDLYLFLQLNPLFLSLGWFPVCSGISQWSEEKHSSVQVCSVDRMIHGHFWAVNKTAWWLLSSTALF